MTVVSWAVFDDNLSSAVFEDSTSLKRNLRSRFRELTIHSKTYSACLPKVPSARGSSAFGTLGGSSHQEFETITFSKSTGISAGGNGPETRKSIKSMEIDGDWRRNWRRVKTCRSRLTRFIVLPQLKIECREGNQTESHFVDTMDSRQQQHVPSAF